MPIDVIDFQPAESIQSIGEWADSAFGKPAAGSPSRGLRLLIEAIELALAMGATRDEVEEAAWSVLDCLPASDYGTRNPDPAKVPEELADIAIVGATIMHDLGIGAGPHLKEVDRKMAVNRRRRWAKTMDGCGQHTEETP